MHVWGKWDDKLFAQVGQAADEIGDFCRKWGRISVTCTKEKYGTARVYCSLGLYDLHGLLYPGYHYVKPWMRKLNFTLPRCFAKYILRYQEWIYNLAYQKAFSKYPKILAEIYYGADYEELIDVPCTLSRVLLKNEKKQAASEIMDLFYALRSIKGKPTLKDLVKLARRIKNG